MPTALECWFTHDGLLQLLTAPIHRRKYDKNLYNKYNKKNKNNNNKDNNNKTYYTWYLGCLRTDRAKVGAVAFKGSLQKVLTSHGILALTAF